MVADRTLKRKAREYAEDFGVSYPRALADLTAPGLVVPLHSKTDRDRFGFDPRTDRHLILTGSFEERASVLERVFGRLYFRPGVERFIIDVTGDFAALSELAEDGSEGAAVNPAAAARVLSDLIHNATNYAHPDYRPVGQFDVLFINGLPELLRASPESAELLSRLITMASAEQSLVLAGEWIGRRPVPGGPVLEKASRLHCGPLGDLSDFPPKKDSQWREMDPEDGEAIYHQQGWKPEKIKISMPASAS